MDGSTKLSELLTAIQHKSGIPPSQQRLMSDNCTLDIQHQNHTLSELPLLHNSHFLVLESSSNRKRKLNDSDDIDSDAPQSKRMKLNNLSTKQVISALNDIFIEIEQPCDLTIGGRNNSLPLIPGLYIKGIGDIPLPISDAQIKLLLSTASKSSFGHGTKTENDEKVRKSLELTPDQFYFKNPEWNKQIKKLIESTAMKLGCNDNSIEYVKGHCYKLLIYEKDGHFVEHRDTQKLDGMFATLIVQLPSKYTMIDNKPVLKVKHRDTAYNYYFGTKNSTNTDDEFGDCQYHIYYAAHYVDLKHQINIIKSGIRMVITYNLCWNGPKNIMPQISNVEKITDGIDNIFKQWIPTHTQAIAINLDHVYTDNELSKKGINALKGSDFAKIHSLMQSKSAKTMNFQIFIAEAHRTIHKSGGGGYDYYDCDWDEVDRSESVKNTWYSSKGKKFKFGQFIDINLKRDCIGYNEEDEEWEEIDQRQEGYLGNEGATQTTIYSKYVAIFFKKENQFELLLSNGIEGGIEWIKYLLTKDINRDISAEIKVIINKFNGNQDKIHIVSMLDILLKTNNFELMGMFINESLIPHKISFHASRYTIFVEKIGDVIVEYGWNEPIKSAVLNLIDCMNNNECNIRYINQYCALLKILENKHYIHCKYKDLYDAIDESVLIRKLNITHDINKEIAEYALDNCFEAISDKLWMNIVNKLNLNGNGEIMRNLDASNVVCILQFILSYNTDKEHQKLMFDKFNTAYNRNISGEKQYGVLFAWINYITSQNVDVTPQIYQILMDKFKPNYSESNRCIPLIFNILIKTNNLELIKQFIDDKLIAYNIGLHQQNYSKYIIHLIIEYGWKDSIKSLVFELLNCMNNTQCAAKRINDYCLLPKLIKDTFLKIRKKQAMEYDDDKENDGDDEDDDIFIIDSNNNNKENTNLSNINIEYLNICWKEIANQIWKNIMQKLEFNGDGKMMRKLHSKNIICILELMILCDAEWDKEYKQKIYKLFENIYSKNVNHKTQNEIVSKIKSWKNKSLYEIECIQTVFKERIKYLSNIKKPEFSWNMLEDGHVSDKKLETFLKSNGETFIRSGFKGIGEARKWGSSYHGMNDSYSYSIKCEAEGRGRSSYVTVEKTKNCFNRKKMVYNAMKRELNLLLSFMK